MKKTLNRMQEHYAKKSARPIPHTIWTNPIHFVACGFGVGLIPIMPGTFGTLLGVVLYLILVKLPLMLYIFSTVGLIAIGAWICGITNRDFGTTDHPAAVFDEIATFPLVMIGVPNTWPYLLIGFGLFRLFDILKPPPINWIDRHVHGGIGVMLDDVLAALFSLAVLQFMVFVFQ